MHKSEVAKKLQQFIANSDSEHEVSTAKSILESILTKYNITLDEDLQKRELRYKKRTEKLHYQVCSMLFYKRTRYVYNHSRKHVILIECTEREQIEAQATYDFYDARFAEELDIFMSAFIQKNRIFSPDAPAHDHDEETPEERMRIQKAALIAQGLNRHTRHKQLEGKKS